MDTISNSIYKRTLIIAVLFVALVATSFLSAQYISEGRVVPLTWTTAAPKMGEVGIKGTASSSVIFGVALDGVDNSGGTRQIQTKGVFRLPVYPRIGPSTGSAIVVGDTIYGSFADIDDGRSTLSKQNDGVPIGKALDAASAATGTTSLIRVLIK